MFDLKNPFFFFISNLNDGGWSKENLEVTPIEIYLFPFMFKTNCFYSTGGVLVEQWRPMQEILCQMQKLSAGNHKRKCHKDS